MVLKFIILGIISVALLAWATLLEVCSIKAVWVAEKITADAFSKECVCIVIYILAFIGIKWATDKN